MQQSVAAPGNEGQKQRPLHLRASGYLVEQASNLLRALSSLVFGNRGGPAEPGVRIAGAGDTIVCNRGFRGLQPTHPPAP